MEAKDLHSNSNDFRIQTFNNQYRPGARFGKSCEDRLTRQTNTPGILLHCSISGVDGTDDGDDDRWVLSVGIRRPTCRLEWAKTAKTTCFFDYICLNAVVETRGGLS